jgi:hypothetical protein
MPTPLFCKVGNIQRWVEKTLGMELDGNGVAKELED